MLVRTFLHVLVSCVVKPRLMRLDRVFVRAPVYFVTANTAGRRPILNCSAIHEAFRFFTAAGVAHRIWVGCYVLMPDHLHLFVACPGDGIPLSGWMKSLKNRLSRTWRAEGVLSPHWQKGFFDHLLRSDESASEKWIYVRENPVRAGLVARRKTGSTPGSYLSSIAGSSDISARCAPCDTVAALYLRRMAWVAIDGSRR